MIGLKFKALAREVAACDRRGRGDEDALIEAARAVLPPRLIAEEAERLEDEFQAELAAIRRGERKIGIGVEAATAVLKEAYDRKVTEAFVGEFNPWLPR